MNRKPWAQIEERGSFTVTTVFHNLFNMHFSFFSIMKYGSYSTKLRVQDVSFSLTSGFVQIHSIKIIAFKHVITLVTLSLIL